MMNRMVSPVARDNQRLWTYIHPTVSVEFLSHPRHIMILWPSMMSNSVFSNNTPIITTAPNGYERMSVNGRENLQNGECCCGMDTTIEDVAKSVRY